MARLIPPTLPEDAPRGELAFHAMMLHAPEEWAVIHGLDLSPVSRGRRTEIDFVVVIPDAGILCVEVKSHERVQLDAGGWSTGRDPFKQALDARFALMRRLGEVAPQLRDVPVLHLAVFPNAEFQVPPTLAVQRWEVMDMWDFISSSDGRTFADVVRNKFLANLASDGRVQPLRQPLSAGTVENIVSYCLPVQRHPVNARQAIELRERQLEQLLREPQKVVMRLAAANERVVVTGGAGTGKTLIAREVALWHARQGRRVGLLCFNQLIGRQLMRSIRTDVTAGAVGNLVCGSVHSVLGAMAGLASGQKEERRYWDETFPEQLLNFLTDPHASADCQFDALVLDEAQDVMARVNLFNALEGFLKGGWQDGRFIMFGDFENQVLSELPVIAERKRTLKEVSRAAEIGLDENCRNYRAIGNAALALSGVSTSVYSGYMRGAGEGSNFDIEYHDSEADEIRVLRQWLQAARAEGYRDSEIVLLSFRADEKAAAGRLIREGFRLVREGQDGEGFRYASVQAFKGLEAKVVIVTDVHFEYAALCKNLLYVAITRAIERVRVSCHRNQSKQLLANAF